LFKTYAGRAVDLASWLEKAEINRDRNLRLQYLAGLWLNVDHSKQIFNEMVGYRKFPEEVFVGSGLRTKLLRGTLNPHP
jgi:spermidine synthase